MKSLMIGAMVAICRVALGASDISTTGTNGADAVRIRAEFAGIAQPIHYESSTKRGDHFTLSWIELNDGARMFGEKYSAKELIYALWPWLDDAGHAPEATIMLLGVTGRQMMRSQKLTYVDSGKPGNWTSLAPGYIDECKIACRLALNQPDWWYPHQVLFNRDAILAESKTNELTRANYVSTMQKALADPAVRTGNPLEANSILLILSALDAKEAAPMFVDYAFFDFKTGNDYRRSSGNTNNFSDVYLQVLPSTTVLPRLGKEFVPLVLKRLSNATPEDQSIQAGGGATPVLAILYFIQVGLSENEAQQVVEQGLKDRNLTDAQRAALTEIKTAITNKLYRPDWLRQSSIASKKTWATPK